MAFLRWFYHFAPRNYPQPVIWFYCCSWGIYSRGPPWNTPDIACHSKIWFRCTSYSPHRTSGRFSTDSWWSLPQRISNLKVARCWNGKVKPGPGRCWRRRQWSIRVLLRRHLRRWTRHHLPLGIQWSTATLPSPTHNSHPLDTPKTQSHTPHTNPPTYWKTTSYPHCFLSSE